MIRAIAAIAAVAVYGRRGWSMPPTTLRPNPRPMCGVQGSSGDREVASRIFSVAQTAAIEVSSTDSDSSAYVVVHRDGSLSLIPFRSEMSVRPKGSVVTPRGVVDFADIHRRIAAVVVADKTDAGDRLVYFVGRRASANIAVFIPAAKSQIARSLFEKFAAGSHVPVHADLDVD